jgi:hypothetical protein
MQNRRPAPTLSYPRGAFPRIEWPLAFAGISGNPFDPDENDIRVLVRMPGNGEVSLPAFYIGENKWAVRHRPHATGRYSIAAVTRNGRPLVPRGGMPAPITVGGKAGAGFVRRDPKGGFRHDNGTAYYPIGHNVGWGRGPDSGDDIAQQFAKMGAAGENWARVWMCHWDGKNLDWVMGAKNELGRLDLTVARRWDKIMDAAEKHGIFVQMVLQHHGQYSTTTNPNWGENPWNRQLGGFLNKPEEFFTDEQARKLTRAKYRYILARWGHSPHILCWELFNEVEWVDALRTANRPEIVAAWHKEMAAHLRGHDPYRHLVASSSKVEISGLYDSMDFVQPHVYAPNPVSAVQRPPMPEKLPKPLPVFFGEFGPGGDLNADDGSFLHTALWTSLMSVADGAAMYWQWENVERRNLYPRFASAAAFLKASKLGAARGLRPRNLTIETEEAGTLTGGPGIGWGKSERTNFVASPSGGGIVGIEQMSSFLQGDSNRAMNPYADFVVNYRQPGEFRVRLAQSAKAGAKVVLKLDGEPVTEQEFAAADRDQRVEATLIAKVPAGAHTIRLENVGTDWVVVDRITLTPYGPSFQGVAKGAGDRAACFLYRGPDAGTGTARGAMTLPGLRPGKYRVLWWNTWAGKPLSEAAATVAAGKQLRLTTPPFAKDLAVFVERK